MKKISVHTNDDVTGINAFMLSVKKENYSVNMFYFAIIFYILEMASYRPPLICVHIPAAFGDRSHNFLPEVDEV